MKLSGAALGLLLLGLSVPAQAGARVVWAVSDGEKISRDALASPLKTGNSAWDGTTIRLFGAGNEIVAFQVIVEADDQGVASLTASLPDLTGSGGAIRYEPPASDPTAYLGRPIQLFSVHYLNVARETHADWAWKPGSPAAPRDATGWKPVVLVPENARAGRGGFPLRVDANRNQALWIEIYTGRDRPAGRYRGTVMVTADGRKHPLPVELQIFDFALPD
ncbi:MAG TPA: hypothetical protein VMV21_01720, partial [Vicinamibacteria bacterium]|nr:hypothetical protein [Vicinamibacteria bacterium]